MVALFETLEATIDYYLVAQNNEEFFERLLTRLEKLYADITVLRFLFNTNDHTSTSSAVMNVVHQIFVCIRRLGGLQGRFCCWS